jgi:hypothetical protein
VSAGWLEDGMIFRKTEDIYFCNDPLNTSNTVTALRKIVFWRIGFATIRKRDLRRDPQ